ncbi:MAG: hypothetical protein FJ010_09520 [Chloroflexi bacterium]|nr:hypothetical protein [Chloroflexota bacterium]
MKTIQRLKIAGLIPLGLATAVSLLFGIGEMAGGDWSGVGHLIPAAIIIGLMWLGWKRPLWAGIPLLILGVVAAFYFTNEIRSPQDWLPPFLIFITPLLLSGSLFLGAAWVSWRQP